MGLILSLGRRYAHTANNETANNTQLNTIGTGSNEQNDYLPHQTNSRLNLINQLIVGFNGNNNNANRNRRSRSRSGLSSKKSKFNNLNDFTNISFASHFYMAGRKFKNIIGQTQTFLFGDQLDLGFILSHKPVAFPYDVSPVDTPSNYLQSLVNIRKDTLKLVKCIDTDYDYSCDSSSQKDESAYRLSKNDDTKKYNIEFRFDSECDVTIKIHYFAVEKFGESSSEHRALSYTCGCARVQAVTNLNTQSLNNLALVESNNINSPNKCFCLNDDSIVYKKGVNVLFQQNKHVIIPAKFNNSVWQFNLHTNYYPIVIECTPVGDELKRKHAHITLAYIDKTQTILNTPIPSTTPVSNEQNLSGKSVSVGCISQINHVYQIKAVKQKQFINGVLYSLQEIYGIEKKSADDDLSCSRNNLNLEYEQAGAANKNLSISQMSCSGLTSSTETTTTSSSTASSTSKSNGKSTDSGEDAIKQVKDPNELEHEREQELKGVECVICMSEIRDCLILPCRHLCLCKMCAVNLRLQSNTCPICRIPFVALLQIKLFRKREKQLSDEKVKQMVSIGCDESIETLPVVKLDQVSRAGPNENVIIQISDKVRSGDDYKKEVLLMSENKMRKNSSLFEFYECITIYEAFIGAAIKNLELVENNEHEQVKKKSRIKTKKSNKKEQSASVNPSTATAESNRLEVQKSDFKFEAKAKSLNSDSNKHERSQSVLVTPTPSSSLSGAQSKSTKSLSNQLNCNTSTNKLNKDKITRSAVDINETANLDTATSVNSLKNEVKKAEP